ncbi:MAG: exonuclease domain-containing protein [Legionellaceae bacterium]|nr:exonuclease domain-containing protein [Legionellaceae bacterium]
MTSFSHKQSIRTRFRGFLPVVVDIETSGLDPQANALLEIGIVLLDRDKEGVWGIDQSYFEHVLPFEDAILDPEALAFNKIDPFYPLRFAVSEKEALERLFAPIEEALKKHRCKRAVLVGHNAWFDLLFLKSAVARVGCAFPFHAFTCFDTATLGGFMYGETVLAKAVRAARIPFDLNEAHSAVYDAHKTAELFCAMVNTLGPIKKP